MDNDECANAEDNSCSSHAPCTNTDVHIPVHVISATEADPMTVLSVSLMMNVSKIPTTVK